LTPHDGDAFLDTAAAHRQAMASRSLLVNLTYVLGYVSSTRDAGVSIE
jgi:hypothetical protein